MINSIYNNVANIKSAVKRIRVGERNRLFNKNYNSSIKTLSKKYYQSLSKTSVKNVDEIQRQLNQLYSKIDKAVNKKVWHKNKAARKKSLLIQKFKLAFQEENIA
uniref:Ribosomal protein S20 n=1 Tax=Sciadococcus taiwanensis TaxID=3028030 RepID=A0A9Y1MWP8_9RHOD|nr:ribosomal protein S20 [Sciadococcus taiwanensis]